MIEIQRQQVIQQQLLIDHIFEQQQHSTPVLAGIATTLEGGLGGGISVGAGGFGGEAANAPTAMSARQALTQSTQGTLSLTAGSLAFKLLTISTVCAWWLPTRHGKRCIQ